MSEALAKTGTSYNATRMLLRELTKNGWLLRLKKGRYVIVPLGERANVLKDWYSVAEALALPHPYYISHYSALTLHGMTTQPFLKVISSSPARIRSRKVAGVEFNFVYCSPNKFWGTKELWVSKQKKVRVSDLERTIIDSLARLDLCGGLSEIAKGIWIKRKEIDFKKLYKYAENYRVAAVAKRLAFLLNIYKLAPLKVAKKLISKKRSYVLLDPTLPQKGYYSKEWMLLINSNPEELKKIIWT